MSKKFLQTLAIGGLVAYSAFGGNTPANAEENLLSCFDNVDHTFKKHVGLCKNDTTCLKNAATNLCANSTSCMKRCTAKKCSSSTELPEGEPNQR